MNSVLRDVLETGHVRLAGSSPEKRPVHSNISTMEGEFLRSLVEMADPTTIVEVGLAYGISALYMCDGLKVRHDTRYYAIDPNQNGGEWGTNWEGIGISNLDRAGYGKFIELIPKPSHLGLPELELREIKADFAFIDGWHTFDHALVDFFYIDRILRVGGVIAFDDANWPAVRKLCRFVAKNRAYKVIDTIPKKSRKRKTAERLLSLAPYRIGHFISNSTPLNKLQLEHVDREDFELNIVGSCVAFQKISDDDRNWDHYTKF